MDALFEHWRAETTIILTTAFAMLLGGVVGFEREMKDRPAGFRTHMLIGGAAALLVGLADMLAERFVAEQYRELVRVDPIRVIEATVAAVGFLGAGAIFRRGDGGGVAGLTTAASMLMVAAIGIAAGLHHYLLGLAVTLMTLVVLRVLAWFEKRTVARTKVRQTDR